MAGGRTSLSFGGRKNSIRWYGEGRSFWAQRIPKSIDQEGGVQIIRGALFNGDRPQSILHHECKFKPD